MLGYGYPGDLIAPARLDSAWGFDAKALTVKLPSDVPDIRVHVRLVPSAVLFDADLLGVEGGVSIGADGGGRQLAVEHGRDRSAIRVARITRSDRTVAQKDDIRFAAQQGVELGGAVLIVARNAELDHGDDRDK